MKLYNLEFAKISYSQDIANGINLIGKIEYQQKAMQTTDFSFFHKDDLYSSNNPLAPNDFMTDPFQEHHLIRRL
jgi:hypothetical protein